MRDFWAPYSRILINTMRKLRLSGASAPTTPPLITSIKKVIHHFAYVSGNGQGGSKPRGFYPN